MKKVFVLIFKGSHPYLDLSWQSAVWVSSIVVVRERGALKGNAGDSRSKGKEVGQEVTGLDLRSDARTDVSVWNSLISIEILFYLFSTILILFLF